MSEHGDDGDDYELVMPFVTVASKGGPHDDESYVAGYEMGALDVRLGIAALHHAVLADITVRVDSIDQVELLAMKHGFTVLSEIVAHDWCEIRFRRAEPL